MPARSYGIAMWRRVADHPELLLGHMGGPFWERKDAAAWSIPKGLADEGEDPIDAAIREFAEELGIAFPGDRADLVELGEFRQSSSKLVVAWSFDASGLTVAPFGSEHPAGVELPGVVSNTFELEWPPRSGRLRSFPEIDRAAWFDLATAREKCVRGQIDLVEILARSIE
ncbi:MAG: NUDIX domain-containing protein [Actinomycetota bacterium]